MRLLVNIFLTCLLTWTFVQSNTNQREKIFFIENSSAEDKETLLVVTWNEIGGEISSGCEIFKDKDLIGEVSKLNPDIPTRKLPKSEMDNLLSDCTEFTLRKRRSAEEEIEEISEDDIKENGKGLRNGRNTRRTSSSRRNTRRVSTTSNNQVETTTAGYDGLPLIFPGTKWCGSGDIAKNYKDLGLHQDTDRCCRAHDFCNDTLAPDETRENIKNTSPFTKLHCRCDNDFFKCLNRVNTVSANTIGNLFFNVLKRDCYRKVHPQTKKCKRYATFLKITCLEYARDTKAPKVYEWFKPQQYKKLPIPGPLTITIPSLPF